MKKIVKIIGIAFAIALLCVSCKNAVTETTNTITFNPNGGTGTMASQTITSGSSANLTANSFTCAGYVFAGWAETASATTVAYKDKSNYTMGTSDVTLYALWTALPTYAITYDSNNCTSGTAPSAQTKTESTDLKLAANTGNLARKSCTFAGWNTAKDGSGTDYAAGATYSGNTALTLFAKWKVASNIKFGFSALGPESSWRAARTKSVQDAITDQGASILFSAGDNTQATQIAAIRDFIAQKADAIVLDPYAETGWVTVLGEAKAAGIPVILIDRAISEDSSLYFAQITDDFEGEGKKLANQLVALNGTTATIKILEIEGPSGHVAAVARKKGFDAVIALYPSYSIVASVPIADWNPTTANTVTTAQFGAHPEINVVYSHNDGMATGAINAITAAGKTCGTGAGQITILSIDAGKEGLQKVFDGATYASCECSPFCGPTTVDVTVKYLEGRLTGKTFSTVDKVYTKADVTQAIVDARTY